MGSQLVEPETMGIVGKFVGTWRLGARSCPQAVEKNGRHEETRTPDLYRVKAHLFNPLNSLRDRWEPPKPQQIRVTRSFDGLKSGLEFGCDFQVQRSR